MCNRERITIYGMLARLANYLASFSRLFVGRGMRMIDRVLLCVAAEKVENGKKYCRGWVVFGSRVHKPRGVVRIAMKTSEACAKGNSSREAYHAWCCKSYGICSRYPAAVTGPLYKPRTSQPKPACTTHRQQHRVYSKTEDEI